MLHVDLNYHHHHHHIFICLIYTIQKNLFTAVIARRRGDPGSHQAYGRATSLTLINKVKKKCRKCAAKPIQGLFKQKLLHFRLKTKKV